MTICNCEKYKDLDGRPSLNKRGHDTKSIVSNLILIAEHSDKEHKLFKCPICGQLWQRSGMRGNKTYLFKVPKIEMEEWNAKPYVQPYELFNRVAFLQQYLEGVSFEEQPQKCKKENCDNYAIKLSVLCAWHHMESIGIKMSLPDNWTWFSPYDKKNYELSMEQLKELPMYKPLKDNDKKSSEILLKTKRAWLQKLFGFK